jgi:hypothetical protein
VQPLHLYPHPVHHQDSVTAQVFYNVPSPCSEESSVVGGQQEQGKRGSSAMKVTGHKPDLVANSPRESPCRTSLSSSPPSTCAVAETTRLWLDKTRLQQHRYNSHAYRRPAITLQMYIYSRLYYRAFVAGGPFYFFFNCWLLIWN